MNNERKRAILTWAYPGTKWLETVGNMSNRQVHSTYMRLLFSNKLKGINPNVEARKL